MKETKKLKEKTLAKEKVEGMVEKKSPQEAAGHNSEPPKQNHTIVDQGCSWTTPLKKMFELCFLIGFLIRHHKFWEIRHFWDFQMKETKKINKWKKSFGKGKGKGNGWKKKSPQEAAGHNSEPPKQTILLWIRVADGLPFWKIVRVMFFLIGF